MYFAFQLFLSIHIYGMQIVALPLAASYHRNACFAELSQIKCVKAVFLVLAELQGYRDCGNFRCLNLNVLRWPSISDFPSIASTFQNLLLLQLTPSYRIDRKSLCIFSVPDRNIYFQNINFEICWNIFI